LAEVPDKGGSISALAENKTFYTIRYTTKQQIYKFAIGPRSRNIKRNPSVSKEPPIMYFYRKTQSYRGKIVKI